MVTLQNEFLRVEISPLGAQLTSIFNKLNKVEHLWQADPAVWGYHAPNLFPVVGGCFNDVIQVDGRTYPMERHGFARTSEFIIQDCSDAHAKFSLSHSATTHQVYPFKFTFQVLYDLFDSELRVSYKVINEDENAIYFSVGAHPAFNIPFFKGEKYDDYYIEFEVEEQLIKHLFSDEGYFNGERENLSQNGNKIDLNKDLFSAGALVFKSLASREVLIKNHKTPNFISVSFPHFESLGIWAPPGADFVCIEPWLGYGDSVGGPGDFRNKEGLRKLEHGHVFEVDYTIGIT
ncbi:aldose 1-epimerase family protein [Daejeonella sp. JGW-45]|uniref:aldose 1-epimerase family protein n=1 Tax=Daejeonella sp. JGW-45 TaxID=3034148 RepID=UPI0023EC9DB5|nr:aldose 1-epimerase family protein [Daejeonella sp. JGW-45]